MADLLIANQRQECGVSAPYLLKLRVEQDFLFRLQTESNSGSLNLDPAEIRVFKNTLGDFEAPEKKKNTARWRGGLFSFLRNWF